MRVLKIKIPSKTLLELGLPNHFEVVDHVEVLQIYQYDSKNFFAMSKIKFRNDKIGEVDRYLRELFFAQSYQILEEKSNEILCIMKQRKTSGFWPALLSSSAVLIPPIILDPNAVVFSIIPKDDERLNTIINQLKMFKQMQLLSITNIDEKTTSSLNTIPMLTSRQKEIMTFATRHGYFEIPKQITTQQVAQHFDVSSSAILNHLQKAEKILMRFYFG
jgi:predicted DNA binding protein